MKTEKDLLNEIEERVRDIYLLRKENEIFTKGESMVHYGGRVYDEKEMIAAVRASVDFWLTLGKYGTEFEARFSRFLGVEHIVMTNSGSSSNMLAVATLCSERVKDHLKPGDEVITTAMAFPTTIAPIVQYGLIPVFIDIELDTYNIDPARLEDAVSDKTRALFFAHTLGNPANMSEIMPIVKKHNLFLIEDTCDALDSKINGRLVGTFGHMATFSFYAAHHITMGEGGALVMSDKELYKNAKSIRDWGRACWCKTGESNQLGACKNRFGFKFDGLPQGFDHKYVYTNIGYNLKPTDIQCAIGIEQLKKLPDFTEKRTQNYKVLFDTFKEYEDFFILPRSYEDSEPSWFVFPVTVDEKAGFTNRDMVNYLEEKKIETRMLFAGNILRHPAYRTIVHRISGSLANSDFVLNNSFFFGLFPGMTEEMIEHIIESVHGFFREKGSAFNRG